MRFLRFWLAGIWLTVYWATRALVASWRGVPSSPGGIYDRAAYQWSKGLLAASRITVKVEGLERVTGLPCVFVANHVSMIDIWALVVYLPVVPKFVMKKELLRVPILGVAARGAGHIVIDRKNLPAAFDAYDQAAEVIRKGSSACVFAEGTRSRTGRLLPFKKGPFVLAIAAQVPVVPVLVEGAFELMPRLSLAPHPGVVTLRFGDPIPTAGLGYDARDALSRQAWDTLVVLGAQA